MQLNQLRASYRYNSDTCWKFFKAFKSILIDAAVLDATLACGPLRSFGKLTTLLLMLFSFPHNNWRVSLSSPTASWMLESLCTWCFSWTEKIDFFINSRQRTSRFSVRLSDYFPNPAPQNRRFPCPVPQNRRFPCLVHKSLNSWIPAFNKISPIPDPEKPTGNPLVAIYSLPRILCLFRQFLPCSLVFGFHHLLPASGLLLL